MKNQNVAKKIKMTKLPKIKVRVMLRISYVLL